MIHFLLQQFAEAKAKEQNILLHASTTLNEQIGIKPKKTNGRIFLLLQDIEEVTGHVRISSLENTCYDDDDVCSVVLPKLRIIRGEDKLVDNKYAFYATGVKGTIIQ